MKAIYHSERVLIEGKLRPAYVGVADQVIVAITETREAQPEKLNDVAVTHFGDRVLMAGWSTPTFTSTNPGARSGKGFDGNARGSRWRHHNGCRYAAQLGRVTTSKAALDEKLAACGDKL